MPTMLFLVTKIQGYETIAAGNPDEELHKVVSSRLC